MRAAVAGARRMGALPARRRASAREATRNGVFISVDMEGMAGIVQLQQVVRGTSEFQRSCRLMTGQANAAPAGHYGVRSALITGDQTAVAEAESELKGIHGVVVKQAIGRQAARSLHPVEACRRIEEGAFRAVTDGRERPVYRLKGPFELEIDWLSTAMADLVSYLPEIERASGRTVRYRSEDYLDCYRVLLALIGLAAPAAYQYPRP